MSEDSVAFIHPDDPGGDIDDSTYKCTRRPPQRPLATKSDIYVSATRGLGPLHGRVKDLFFKENLKAVTVHGLGPACILDATLLAVEACERYSPWLAAGTVTGTEAMVDEYTPLLPGLKPFTRQRLVSAIHITLTRVSSESIAATTSGPLTAASSVSSAAGAAAAAAGPKAAS